MAVGNKATPATTGRSAASKAAASRRKAEVAKLNEQLRRARAAGRARRNPAGGGELAIVAGGAGGGVGALLLASVLPAGAIADYGSILAPIALGWWLRKKAKTRELGTGLMGAGAALAGLKVYGMVVGPAANPPRRRSRSAHNPAPLLTQGMSGRAGGSMTDRQLVAAGLRLW